jgi:hypothetical protein
MPKVDVAWDRARDRVLELGTVCSSFWIYVKVASLGS